MVFVVKNQQYNETQDTHYETRRWQYHALTVLLSAGGQESGESGWKMNITKDIALETGADLHLPAGHLTRAYNQTVWIKHACARIAHSKSRSKSIWKSEGDLLPKTKKNPTFCASKSGNQH